MFRKITAPSVDTLTTNEAVFRLYGGRINEYGYFSNPQNSNSGMPVDNVSIYALVWTTPSRLSATFRYQPGPTGGAQSEIDTLDKRGMLAAHTLVIKPLHPEIYADPNKLLPPSARPIAKAWYAENGASPGQEPGVDPAWVEKTIASYKSGTTYAIGDAVWYEGNVWVATQAGTLGEPDVDPAWQKVLAWDPNKSYPAGSYVTHGTYEPGGAPAGVEEDKFFVGRPPGGNVPQVFMRGVTYDGYHLWMVDDGAKAILRSDRQGLWMERFWLDTTWRIQLRDITFAEGFLWVIRQDNETILKIDRNAGVVDTIPLSAFTPLAIAYDDSYLWVHSVAQSQLVIMNTAGGLQFTRAYPWTDANLSGAGWDDCVPYSLWMTNPVEYAVRRADLASGAYTWTRGWDVNHQAPQSVHRGGDTLWVCTANWVHWFYLPCAGAIVEPLDTYYDQLRILPIEYWGGT